VWYGKIYRSVVFFEPGASICMAVSPACTTCCPITAPCRASPNGLLHALGFAGLGRCLSRTNTLDRDLPIPADIPTCSRSACPCLRGTAGYHKPTNLTRLAFACKIYRMPSIALPRMMCWMLYGIARLA